MLFCLQSPHSHVEYIDLALVLGKECGGKACVAKPEGCKVLQGELHCTLHPPAAPARSYKGGALHPDFDSPATPPPPSPEPVKSRGVALLCSLLLSLQHPAITLSESPSQCRLVHWARKYLHILLLSFLILF